MTARHADSSTGGADPKSSISVPDRNQRGDEFILDGPTEIQSVWGSGSHVLWPRGEALWLVGPPGVGKSTLIQQVLLHGIGVRSGPFLDHPVRLPDSILSMAIVGYIAADRPSQIRRSFQRMVTEADRDRLHERLDVWRGALPFHLDTAEPGAFADFCLKQGWSVVAIDSLKDICSGMTEDKSGLAINQQIQEVLVRGIEVVINHHQRKSTDSNRKPRSLDDVYGSRWLTAGAGSVLMLWGQAGDPIVELTHLKQPMENVGPLTLVHDHALGETRIDGSLVVTKLPTDGLTKVLAALPGTVVELMAATDLSDKQTRRILASLHEKRLAYPVSDQDHGRNVWMSGAQLGQTPLSKESGVSDQASHSTQLGLTKR